MLAIDPKYELLGGAIERNGKHSVQTRFIHLFGFPLIPRESWFVTKTPSEKEVRELRSDGRSIAAGFLRMWPLAGSLWVAMLAGVQFFIPEPLVPFDDDPSWMDKPLLFWIAAGGAAALLVLAGLAWLLTRFPLSRDEKARRQIYFEFVGAPADPARLPDPWSLRDDLKRLLSDWADQMGIMRFGFDKWQEIVDRPELQDEHVLGAALTLTRLVKGHPEKGADPANVRRLHEQVWAKLCAMKKAA